MSENVPKSLKTFLRRVLRDIEHKCLSPDAELAKLLETATGFFNRNGMIKTRGYSVHAPEVECLSKGKAHKRYEFGCKVSVAATNRGGWFVGAMAMHGKPYDGHTLADALNRVGRQVSRLLQTSHPRPSPGDRRKKSHARG